MTKDEGFIDLHSHILPGLDDGAADWEVFLAMACQSQEKGISTMAATVHSSTENPVSIDDYERVFSEAQGVLIEKGFSLRLIRGSEIYLGPCAADKIKLGELIPLGGTKSYLVELPFTQLPLYIKETIFEMRLVGAWPIVAHPERYHYLERDRGFMREAASQGARFQINAGSLLGKYGQAAKKSARNMLEDNLVHLVASDCHDTENRKQDLPEAYQAIRSEFGEKKANLLFFDNPARVLEGALIELPDQEYKKAKVNWLPWRRKR